jgi:hypothetical protein
MEEHAVSLSGITAGLFSNMTVPEMVRRNAKLCLSKANEKLATMAKSKTQTGLRGEPFDVETIEKCANGHEGQSLLESAVQRTTALDPTMEYAPWVVVDGKPLRDNAYNLKTYICEAYKGPKPTECDTDALKDYFPASLTTRHMTGHLARQQLNQFFDDDLVGGRSVGQLIEASGKQQLYQNSAAERMPPFKFCAKTH